MFDTTTRPPASVSFFDARCVRPGTLPQDQVLVNEKAALRWQIACATAGSEVDSLCIDWEGTCRGSGKVIKSDETTRLSSWEGHSYVLFSPSGLGNPVLFVRYGLQLRAFVGVVDVMHQPQAQFHITVAQLWCQTKEEGLLLALPAFCHVFTYQMAYGIL